MLNCDRVAEAFGEVNRIDHRTAAHRTYRRLEAAVTRTVDATMMLPMKRRVNLVVKDFGIPSVMRQPLQGEMTAADAGSTGDVSASAAIGIATSWLIGSMASGVRRYSPLGRINAFALAEARIMLGPRPLEPVVEAAVAAVRCHQLKYEGFQEESEVRNPGFCAPGPAVSQFAAAAGGAGRS